MDYPSLFRSLYQFVIEVMEWIQPAWEWLNTPIELSGVFYALVNAFSFGTLSWVAPSGITFTPLFAFSGGAILTMMVLYIIKTFIPFV